MSKKNSKHWTESEVSDMISIVQSAPSLMQGYDKAAKVFNKTRNAIQLKYYGVMSKKPLTVKPTSKSASKQIFGKDKQKGTLGWTKKEIAELRSIMKEATTKSEGFDVAAKIIGRSRLAVLTKYSKLKKASKKAYKKARKYRKAPLINAIIDDGGISKVKRKYTKRNPIAKYPITHNVYPVAREITFDIRDVKVDLVNKKITFVY